MRMGNRLAGFACVLVTACVAPPTERSMPRVAVGGDSELVDVLSRVASDSGVPAELLATLAYIETRFRVADDAHHHGRATFGLLGLTADEITRGAALAGVSPDDARVDAEAGLRAGAALLREAAPDARSLDELVGALRPGLQREVLAALGRGIDARDADGRSIVVAARRHAPTGFGVATQEAGYPGATWYPASASNYTEANRGVGDITHVVIHTAQGSFNGMISWFQNPAAQVSAHYAVRSADGHVGQMVSEKNVAWHDRCFNQTTIGIEHEGKIEQPELWYTEAMYVESAKLTAYLADKYGIAKERGPIVGHGEAPDCSSHTDPGPGWDWDHYIDLVRTGGAPMFDAADVAVVAPESMLAGERATVVVTVTNRGNTTWDVDLTRLGTTQPQDRESELFVDGDWVSPSRATSVDARVEPGASGTFTFDIVAPEVAEPRVFDEAFQLVEEGVAWFGPEIRFAVQVLPDRDGDEDPPEASGCSIASSAGAGSGTGAGVMLALGVALRRRRRRARRL